MIIAETFKEQDLINEDLLGFGIEIQFYDIVQGRVSVLAESEEEALEIVQRNFSDMKDFEVVSIEELPPETVKEKLLAQRKQLN